MKKTLLLATALLPVALLAQENTLQVRGKGDGCNGIGRGCVPTSSSISFHIQATQNHTVVLSAPIKNLSEEEQVYLTGDTLNNFREGVFFIQEEDYYFSDEEKRVLKQNENTYLKKGSYPIRLKDDRLEIVLSLSDR